MKFTIKGLTEHRRNDDPDMRDYITFAGGQPPAYLMCEDEWFGRKLRKSRSVDVYFSNEGPLEIEEEDSKLLMLNIDEINKKEGFTVFIQRNVDIWFCVYHGNLPHPTCVGDIWYATVVFRKDNEDEV